MSKKGGSFKAKCSCCGNVKTSDGEWLGSIFIREEMLKGLPKEECPWCLRIKTFPQNILFSLD